MLAFKVIEEMEDWEGVKPYSVRILATNEEIRFKTEEEAHSYAQENGLKEDEYFIDRWMV